MFKVERESVDWGGRELVLETGRVARQADGAVWAKYGETVVLAAVASDKEPRAGLDFMPLTVNYMERAYAAGRVPGGFFKREGRPSEKEILTSRLIDRSIRPLVDGNWRCETQLTIHVLSHDLENDPEVLALVAGSAAMSLSGVPFEGPMAGVRVGLRGEELVLNPTLGELEESGLDLMCAGVRGGVLMVESEASELSEARMLDAVFFGHEGSVGVMDAIDGLKSRAGKPVREAPDDGTAGMMEAARGAGFGLFEGVYKVADKEEREAASSAAKEEALKAMGVEEGDEGAIKAARGALRKVEKEAMRGLLLGTRVRADGRGPGDMRQVEASAGVLPQTHGSALFTRGETQALVVATLGTGEDEQIMDALSGTYKERFLLHYNFPPYSVGETGRVGFTGRREVGHGALARRALRAAAPQHEDFPYTLRLVSEITESNGSSSMATVCGGSLALMDAGVPMKGAVAGVAMGLVKEGDDHVVLTDIMGDEDHLGDMDFKVAGTREGVTALQMDIKIKGVSREIMESALEQAREARGGLLEKMSSVLEGGREAVSEHAPQIYRMTIPKEKIGELIGPGGRVVKGIVEETGAKVSVDDEGVVRISSSDKAALAAAIEQVEGITATPEEGREYKGKVVNVKEFGVFVNFMPGRDGLVHVSQIPSPDGGRIRDVGSVLQEGDEVRVRVTGFDDRGRVRLTMKEVAQEVLRGGWRGV